MPKQLSDLVDARTASKIEKTIRNTAKDLFEPPSAYSSLEETRDNIWEMYISGTITAEYGGKVVGASRRLYDDIFDEIARKHGTGKDSEERKALVRSLARALQERIKAYKKVKPEMFVPAAADLAKLDEFTFLTSCTVLDLVKQATGLVEVGLYGTTDGAKPGTAKALAAAIAARGLRRLVLEEAPGEALDGAIANPLLANVDYLALYETAVKPPQLASALKRWPKLETLALRGPVSAKMLDVIATAAPRLVELALVNAELKDATLEALFTKRRWPKLKRLFLWGHELAPATKKTLASALPKVTIESGE